MKKEDLKTEICSYCRGEGWTPEHSSDPHENGECNGCPVQELCSSCHGEGKIMTLDEVEKLLKSQAKEIIKAIFSGETVEYEGKFFKINSADAFKFINLLQK